MTLTHGLLITMTQVFHAHAYDMSALTGEWRLLALTLAKRAYWDGHSSSDDHDHAYDAYSWADTSCLWLMVKMRAARGVRVRHGSWTLTAYLITAY